jgi:hypothetical protein
MALSRDDEANIKCKLLSSSNTLNYMLNVPGNGLNPDYFIDPQIRLQKFGGNIGKNIVDINSNLLGVNKQLIKYDFTLNSRDSYIKTDYIKNEYPTINYAVTDQSRSVLPAWQLKDLERMNWAYPLEDPQLHIQKAFVNNVNTRQHSKDIFNTNYLIY